MLFFEVSCVDKKIITMDEENDICLSYSINDLLNDSILQHNVRLQYFNELKIDDVQDKPFIRFMFFDPNDTCRILTVKTLKSCSILEIKSTLPKYFNLINFEKDKIHELYDFVEFEYSRKILYFFDFHKFMKSIPLDKMNISKVNDEKFIILEYYDGNVYQKRYTNKLNFLDVCKLIY